MYVKLFSQGSQKVADSLYSAFLKEKVDTQKVNILVNLCVEYEPINAAKGIAFAREGLAIAEHIGFARGQVRALIQIADYNYDQVNYSEAVRNYLKAAKLAEQEKMYASLCQCYNGMGIIYSNQNKHDQALKYFMKLARVAEERKFNQRLSIAYNNIGITYKDMGRLNEAATYYKKALAEFQKNNFARGIGSATNNLGTIAKMQGKYEEALQYYESSIQLFRESRDTASEAGIYTNIGELYYDQKQYRKALDFYLKGQFIAERYHNVNNFRGDAYEGLAKVYAGLEDYRNAYKYTVRYQAWKDSVTDEEGMRQVTEIEKRLENEKHERELESLRQKEEIRKLQVEKQNQQLRQSRMVIYFVAGILVLVLGMSFFLLKAYRQIKKTNSELAETKKEIQDSINYARHIQQAMLPEVGILKQYFPEGFGLFKPKDVVSGDFYWFNELHGKVYFAVADCTGHGVPGAFMSMIGMDKLNQCLVDKKLSEPSEILSALNVSIRRALRQYQEGSTSRDGMDIVLCCIDPQTRMLSYAGANRPLCLIRGQQVQEFKPTKASIAGSTPDQQVYMQHEIALEKNDSLYLFTDGFADQFGGPEHKKFMSRRLRETLLEISTLPMSSQEIELQKRFDAWRGRHAQVDDVMVLGLRIG
jgi:serine phosphatase RsbU (regulator of sigma subunit)/Flp pilus assembly protein TadD